MKKKIAIMICAFASCMSFAQVEYPTVDPALNVSLTAKPRELKEGILYVRFMASDPSVFTQYQVQPGWGLGYRRLQGVRAFDVTGMFSSHNNYKRKGYIWSFPKVSYLHYLNPLSNQTTYLGAGLSFGGMETERKTRTYFENGQSYRSNRYERGFMGLLGHVTAGVELFRREACVVISELSISQPLLASTRTKGALVPSAEVSCGLGF
jgi:hypothetical protein